MKRISYVTLIIAMIFTGLTSDRGFAQGASFGQQIAILKMIKPDLETIGIMATSLSEKDIANYTRSSLQQGVKVFIAQPKDAREIPVLYKKLISEKKVQLIIIPASDDKVLLDIGYEYLRENTLLDKVGLCVQDAALLSTGAFFALDKADGKLTAYVNQRVATIVGAMIPKQENPSITFVAR
jgi:ABC-type uncharacterized transport system substrate-binding protein